MLIQLSGLHETTCLIMGYTVSKNDDTSFSNNCSTIFGSNLYLVVVQLLRNLLDQFGLVVIEIAVVLLHLQGAPLCAPAAKKTVTGTRVRTLPSSTSHTSDRSSSSHTRLSSRLSWLMMITPPSNSCVEATP